MGSGESVGADVERVDYPGPVRRLRLEWTGKEWTIAGEVRIESMTLPSPDELPAGEETRGFWVEASDGEGKVYHRELQPDPFGGMEFFEEGGEVTRGPVAHDVIVDVLIPDRPEITKIHIVSNPASPGHDQGDRLTRWVLALSRPRRPRNRKSGEV
jgi:hypothetical protein